MLGIGRRNADRWKRYKAAVGGEENEHEGRDLLIVLVVVVVLGLLAGRR
jgi:hypothetical protein